jgi:ATP-dependent DNA ligase
MALSASDAVTFAIDRSTPRPGIVLNEHYDGEGDIVYKYACKLGCEGIVSKRIGSPYRSGRSPLWVKVKNPKAPAVTREAEEDWGNKQRARGWIKVRHTHGEPS